MTRERLWPAVLLAWGIAATVLTLVAVPDIVLLWFPDPDDAMRLLEVRDWLAGQSWWDVAQHRLNGGAFAMHWSRLVDLPLAAVIILFDPLVGSDAANRIAAIGVPLATLLAAMALAAALTRQLADLERAKVALLLLPLSVPIVYQIRPLRIDHHGWQTVMALAALVALFRRPSARSGTAAGLALATLLTISLEGLPITAAILGVAIVAAVANLARRAQLLAMLWSLLGFVVVFHVVTRGPGMLSPACDAIAPGWIAAIAIGVAGASWPVAATRAPLWLRVVALAVAAAASLATLLVLAPGCTRGPFATLDPLVYTFWYSNVSEGLPIWDQVPAWALMTIGFPIVGLIGATLAWRRAQGVARTQWLMMLALGASSFLLSLLVMRTGATANAFAIPGGAWALAAMLERARKVEPVIPRTLATAAALSAATPGLLASALFTRAPAGNAQPHAIVAAEGFARASCKRGEEVADLARLPATTLFAPLDITPALLVATSHRAIASGYHRNATAIHRVIATFLSDPADARRRIAASGARFVVGCPGLNETELYKKVAPNGLWARLERGERFDWLEPVPIPGSPMLAWRVIGSSRKPLSLGASAH